MKKFLPKTLNNPQGFTLVELLVVVSIIAILAVIGLTIFTGVQKTARDAKRRADVEAISKALETKYNNATATYPVIAIGDFASSGIPQDPLGGSYSGVPNAGGATYNVCADLEADSRDPADLSPNDFCISQQQ